MYRNYIFILNISSFKSASSKAEAKTVSESYHQKIPQNSEMKQLPTCIIHGASLCQVYLFGFFFFLCRCTSFLLWSHQRLW